MIMSLKLQISEDFPIFFIVFHFFRNFRNIQSFHFEELLKNSPNFKRFEWGLWAGGQGARKMRISPGKGRTNLPLGARTAEIPK